MTHFRITHEQKGAHVHIDWRSATNPNATHALNGTLVMSPDEWNALRPIMDRFRALFEVKAVDPWIPK